MTQKPCTSECLVRSHRESELRTSAGSYREMLALAADKLEEAGVDAGFFRIFLSGRQDVGAAQAAASTLQRESLKAARDAIWNLEGYVVGMGKELSRRGLIHPVERGMADELSALHAIAAEKVALFRKLDDGLELRHPGEFSTEGVRGADPSAHGQGVKLALAARALLAMDAYILRLRQAYYSGDGEVRAIARALLDHVGSDALGHAYFAFAAMGINGEWCGNADRANYLQMQQRDARTIARLEEEKLELAVQLDDLRAELARVGGGR